MGLNEGQFNALSEEEKTQKRQDVRAVFEGAGADYVIQDITELPAVVEAIQHR